MNTEIQNNPVSLPEEKELEKKDMDTRLKNVLEKKQAQSDPEPKPSKTDMLKKATDSLDEIKKTSTKILRVELFQALIAAGILLIMAGACLLMVVGKVNIDNIKEILPHLGFVLFFALSVLLVRLGIKIPTGNKQLDDAIEKSVDYLNRTILKNGK